ncbi:hypothetical protein PV783_24535 [Chitinophaga sp. CC14]|uniref:hypothetical protein n=1 Tax=Chitinophaga sp. CC14 TaxID=3029199 RepID=UPI003B772F96
MNLRIPIQKHQAFWYAAIVFFSASCWLVTAYINERNEFVFNTSQYLREAYHNVSVQKPSMETGSRYMNALSREYRIILQRKEINLDFRLDKVGLLSPYDNSVFISVPLVDNELVTIQAKFTGLREYLFKKILPILAVCFAILVLTIGGLVKIYRMHSSKQQVNVN